MAQHDALTDLANRILLMDRLSRAVARARRYRTQLALMYLDLDRFKQINDSLGHSAGHEVLQSVATCLLGTYHPRLTRPLSTHTQPIHSEKVHKIQLFLESDRGRIKRNLA